MWRALEQETLAVPAPACYWEVHVKLDDDFHDRVLEVARANRAAVSYSVLKRELQPLLTLRSATCTRADMQARVDRLLLALNTAVIKVLHVQYEYAIYDTLDDGWIIDDDDDKE